LGGRVTAFGDVMLSQNKVHSTAWQAAGQPFAFSSLTVPAGAPYNPLTTTATGVTFADMSRPKAVFDTTDAYRFSAGLKGTLSATWTWQTSVDYSDSKVEERDTNLYSWDAHVAGDLFQLPAGPVSVAVGVGWRHEGVSGHADPNGRVTDPV